MTPEGKARSSRNALKHGLAAAVHLAPTPEDAAELAALEEGLAAELAPESLLETFLVARLAAAMWKMQRADRMEAQALAPATDPLAPGEPGRPGLGLALRYQAAAGRGFHTSLRDLWRLRRQPIFVPAAVRAHVRSAAPARPNEPDAASPTGTATAPAAPADIAPPLRNEPEPSAAAPLPSARPNEPGPAAAHATARRPNEPDGRPVAPAPVPNEPERPRAPHRPPPHPSLPRVGRWRGPARG